MTQVWGKASCNVGKIYPCLVSGGREMAAPDNWELQVADGRSLGPNSTKVRFCVAFIGPGTKEDNKVVDKGLAEWGEKKLITILEQ